MNGILNLYKPSGITSHTAVSIVKRIFGVKKVGHTGTLDPMASGVLPILVGSAVKLSEYMICDDKKYRTRLKLGITTNTEDTTGEILTRSSSLPCAEDIKATIMSFLGEYMQTPPMYSALKVDGKKLYEIARKGGEVEREARKVTIESIEIHEISEDYCDFTVACSKGTYIRTLCADIGKKLGCGGVMASLERLNAGGFGIDSCVTLEALKEMDNASLEKTLITIEDFFAGLEKIRLNTFFSRLALNGAYIFLSKIKTNLDMGQRVLLYNADGKFFALGEVVEIEGNTVIKPIKMFFAANQLQ